MNTSEGMAQMTNTDSARPTSSQQQIATEPVVSNEHSTVNVQSSTVIGQTEAVTENMTESASAQETSANSKVVKRDTEPSESSGSNKSVTSQFIL